MVTLERRKRQTKNQNCREPWVSDTNLNCFAFGCSHMDPRLHIANIYTVDCNILATFQIQEHQSHQSMKFWILFAACYMYTQLNWMLQECCTLYCAYMVRLVWVSFPKWGYWNETVFVPWQVRALPSRDPWSCGPITQWPPTLTRNPSSVSLREHFYSYCRRTPVVSMLWILCPLVLLLLPSHR